MSRKSKFQNPKSRICPWLVLLRAPLICAAWLNLIPFVPAQAVPLAIKTTNNQVVITWPAGLDLVQPQTTTNLGLNAWQDLGAATVSTSLTEAAATGLAFYRLRFLAPIITAQPQGQSAAAGGNATFKVSASGTAPLTFQWQKNNAGLAGQTAATLALMNLTASDSGDYRVLISNRAGAVTSAVAALVLTASLPPPQGIFMGEFSGQTNGGFALFVKTNGTGFALIHHVAQGEGVLSTNLSIGANGGFSLTTSKEGKLSGLLAGDTVNGTLASTNGVTSTLSGARKADTGIHQTSAGFYSGNFGGLLSGNAHMILAADGTVFTYLLSQTLGGGGAFGKIDAANTLAATTEFTLPGTTIPGILGINGTLNPATHQFGGSYSFGGFTLGTFSLVRVSAP